MFECIFGNLRGNWKELNLNEEAKKFPTVDFSNPVVCDQWLKSLHKGCAVEYSYGGFLEDRSFIWKDHYNAREKFFIHEGLDFNVPVKTEVSLFEDGKVVEIMRDTAMHGGWGNAAVFWMPRIEKYSIYAHLDEELIISLGKEYKKGQPIGVVGGPEQNGHYFPHLHIQIMDETFAKAYSRFVDIGGYSSSESKLLKHLYDPIKFIE